MAKAEEFLRLAHKIRYRTGEFLTFQGSPKRSGDPVLKYKPNGLRAT